MSSLRISLCSENAASQILNKERTCSVTQKLHLLKKLSKPLTEHDWQRKSIFHRIHESSPLLHVHCCSCVSVCRILAHVAHRLSEQPCFRKINGMKFAARVSYLVTYRDLLLWMKRPNWFHWPSACAGVVCTDLCVEVSTFNIPNSELRKGPCFIFMPEEDCKMPLQPCLEKRQLR